MRSHIMAPIRPANITSTVENEGCIIPFPTVAATALTNINVQEKLARAEIHIVYSGIRTIVQTTVAMEFAES